MVLPPPVYHFGAYSLDPSSRLLRRNAEVVPLTPKSYDVLLLLVENAGKVVEKEILLRRIWPDSFVEEGNLTYTISILRKTLDDGSTGISIISTVPKRGYQFAIPVESRERSQTVPPSPNLASAKAVLAGGVCVILILAMSFALTRSRFSPAQLQAFEYVMRGNEVLNGSGSDAGFKDRRNARKNARLLFDKALQIDPRSGEAFAGLARVFEEQYTAGDGGRLLLDEALTAAKQALVLEHKLIKARHALIRIYHSTGQAEDGLRQARLALTLSPTGRETLEAAGEAYFRAGMIDRALMLFKRAVEADPLDAGLRSWLARCYFHTGEYLKGIELLAPILGQGSGADWIGMLLLAEHGQFDKAIKLGSELVKKAPASASAWWELGRIHLAAGRHDEARRVFHQGAIQLEHQSSLTNNPRVRAFLGSIYAMLGERLKALQQVEMAFLVSQDPWVLFEGALIHSMLGDYSASIKHFRRAVEDGYRGLHYVNWELRHPWQALYPLKNNPEFQQTKKLLEDAVRKLYAEF